MELKWNDCVEEKKKKEGFDCSEAMWYCGRRVLTEARKYDGLAEFCPGTENQKTKFLYDVLDNKHTNQLGME